MLTQLQVNSINQENGGYELDLSPFRVSIAFPNGLTSFPIRACSIDKTGKRSAGITLSHFTLSEITGFNYSTELNSKFPYTKDRLTKEIYDTRDRMPLGIRYFLAISKQHKAIDPNALDIPDPIFDSAVILAAFNEFTETEQTAIVQYVKTFGGRFTNILNALKTIVPTADAVAPTAGAVAPTAGAVAPTAGAVAPTADAVAPTADAVAPTADAVYLASVPGLSVVA